MQNHIHTPSISGTLGDSGVYRHTKEPVFVHEITSKCLIHGTVHSKVEEDWDGKTEEITTAEIIADEALLTRFGLNEREKGGGGGGGGGESF